MPGYGTKHLNYAIRMVNMQVFLMMGRLEKKTGKVCGGKD